MQMNMLHGMKGWSQFFFFCFLSFSGFVLALFIIALFIGNGSLFESIRTLQMAQMIQTVCLFLFPSIVFAKICNPDFKLYLGIDNQSSGRFLFFVIAFIIVVQPLIYSLSYYNGQITLPGSMAGFEQWMKEAEANTEKVYKILFSDKSITSFILNLLIVAVVAGLAEEFFFRGCLQQIVNKIVLNKHAAIWITAIIFSAIHFQFYGFVPRMLLGALLGYLFIWSGSIWIPVLTHTLHNAINVVIPYLYYGSKTYEQMENLNVNNYAWLILISLFLSAFFLILVYRNRQNR